MVDEEEDVKVNTPSEMVTKMEEEQVAKVNMSLVLVTGKLAFLALEG